MRGIAPFGTAPFGTYGGGLVAACTESLAFHGQPSGIAASPLADVLQLSGASDAQVINVLIERLRLTGTVLPNLDLSAHLTDTLRYEDAMQLGWYLAVQEGINFAATAAAHKTTVAVLMDVLHATGAVNVTLDARAILTSVIAFEALMHGGWKAELMETVEFQDALQAQLGVVAKLVDTASFSGIAGPALRLLALCADDIALNDDPSVSLETFARLHEDVLFYAVIRLDDAEYTAWTLNENAAATEYRNYPFNGLLEFDGRYYGTSDTGLYELAGATDDGQEIEWSIKTGVMDFLTGKLKRIPDCYIAFAGTNEVVLKVIIEENGRRTETIYTATLPPGDALHNGRIKIGRGLSARYWQFALSGKGSFEFDEMAWRPLVLDRRLS